MTISSTQALRQGRMLSLIAALTLGGMLPFASAQAAEASFPTLQDAITMTCQEQASDGTSGPEGCRVLTTKAIGNANGTVLHFARYCLDEPDQTEGNACFFQGMAVFAETPPSGPVERLYSTNSDVSEPFLPPNLINSPYGTILDIAITIDGTGHYNESDYLLLRDGQWQLIDSRSWIDDLLKRIPVGTEIHKGIWPDLSSMTAQVDLALPGDPNCCPSAGMVDIDLELIGVRLSIKGMTVGPARQ